MEKGPWFTEAPNPFYQKGDFYLTKNSEYRNKWISEKLDRVNLTMPKGQKDIVKAHAEAQGESLNAFINRAITETMERETAATGSPEG